MFTINLDHVNHFVLQKHHLTDEAKIDDIVKITRDIAGLHTTNAITPYLSIFSRTKNFTRNKLDEELYIKKTLGKIRCVRKTVYIHPKERISIVFNATKKMVVNISEQFLFKYLRVTQNEYENTSKKIMAARLERLAEQVEDGFWSYLLPHAALKLKQGFGRLIRSRKDVGVVVLLDRRVVTKRYGPALLDSLPPADRVVGHWAQVRTAWEDFFARFGIGAETCPSSLPARSSASAATTSPTPARWATTCRPSRCCSSSRSAR